MSGRKAFAPRWDSRTPNTFHRALPLVLMGLLMLNCCAAMAQTTFLVQDDSEDGTLQGWIPRGMAVLTNTTEVAHGGIHSLKTTGRTAAFNGPNLDLVSTLSKTTVYQITAWVRLVSGEAPDTLKITMQRTAVGGSNVFDQIATSSTNGVTDAGWVMLQGQYSFTTDVSGLLLYVEASRATTQYYLDDFSITEVPALGCSVPPDTTGILTNFEDNTTQGWRPRIGRETVAVTSADAHSGSFSLLTTGRQQSFDGPSINAAGKLCNGSRYNISVWAKLAPGEPDSQLRVSIQRSLGGTTNFNTLVPNTTVTSSQWVRLKATYDFAFNYDSLTLYVESASGTASFYIDDFDLTFVPPPQIEPDIPSVYQTLSDFFPIGAAVSPSDVSGVHAQLLTKHFNSMTSSNDMKWDATERTEGNFTFTAADAEVSFAKANNMFVRGHTLVWHNQIPAWVFQDANGNPMTPTPENKALLLQRLENHIRAVVPHFGNDVYAWDVVNEVIDETQADGFRRSPWFNITGTDYVETAFRVAHEVAPDAKLFINDFNTTQEPKRTFLYNLVRNLQSRGVPIDGVGHQMHSNIQFPSPQAVADTINLFSGLGVDNQITELDISIYTNNNEAFDDYANIPSERFVAQGYLDRDFFQVFRQLKDKISSVTFWGQADDNTWLTTSRRVDAPLLFDQNLQHKLAYLGIIDPLQLPGADLATAMNADSDTVLSGRPVTFQIAVTNNGHDDAANVVLIDPLPPGTVFQAMTAPPDWSCNTPAIGNNGQVSCTAARLNNRDVADFSLTAQVNCSVQDGTSIVNSATVRSSTRNPNPTSNTTASTTIQVSNPPPVIAHLSANPALLWPPDGSLVDVTLSYEVTHTCDLGIVPNVTVTSHDLGDDEDDRDRGNDDESFHDGFRRDSDDHRDADWLIVDAHHVRLRAERERGERIYTITLAATDSAGSSTTSSVAVPVARRTRDH